MYVGCTCPAIKAYQWRSPSENLEFIDDKLHPPSKRPDLKEIIGLAAPGRTRIKASQTPSGPAKRHLIVTVTTSIRNLSQAQFPAGHDRFLNQGVTAAFNL